MLVETLERDVDAHLAALGRVFTTIEHHDSGDTSWGVEVDGRRWFVKCARDEEGVMAPEGFVAAWRAAG